MGDRTVSEIRIITENLAVSTIAMGCKHGFPKLQFPVLPNSFHHKAEISLQGLSNSAPSFYRWVHRDMPL